MNPIASRRENVPTGTKTLAAKKTRRMLPAGDVPAELAAAIAANEALKFRLRMARFGAGVPDPIYARQQAAKAKRCAERHARMMKEDPGLEASARDEWRLRARKREMTMKELYPPVGSKG